MIVLWAFQCAVFSRFHLGNMGIHHCDVTKGGAKPRRTCNTNLHSHNTMETTAMYQFLAKLQSCKKSFFAGGCKHRAKQAKFSVSMNVFGNVNV